MAETFWTKKQDERCVNQYNELVTKLEALGRVVDELAAENGKLREELATRSQTLDGDLTAMESRLITRIEDIEERQSQAGDYSNSEGKTDDSLGGHTMWSERKKAKKTAAADPTKWEKRFKEVKTKPAPPQEK